MTKSDITKLFYYLFHKPIVVIRVVWNYLAPIMPDRLFLKVKFRLEMGYWMDFQNPITYNEKLQWLKINDIHPEYTQLVDKIAVKEYVSSIIGEEIIIPTLGIWHSVDEINWDILPSQFVIKAANDSGGVVVCKNKSELNIQDAIQKLRKDGGRDYTTITREYPYKNVPHRYLAEQYMQDESGCELKDYKFFCFDGKVKFLFVASGRQHKDTRFDFFDIDFNHLPVENGYPNADIRPVKPENYDEMIRVAEKLSQGIKHVRVDLYNVKGKIFFGELTFFHWSGIVPFVPKEWDYKFGEYLTL